MTTLSGEPKVEKGFQVKFMGLEHHGSPKQTKEKKLLPMQRAYKHALLTCGSTKYPCMPYKKITPIEIIPRTANTHNPLHV